MCPKQTIVVMFILYCIVEKQNGGLQKTWEDNKKKNLVTDCLTLTEITHCAQIMKMINNNQGLYVFKEHFYPT